MTAPSSWSVTQSGSRKTHDREAQRLREGHKTLQRISLLPGSRAFRLEQCRIFAVSKASYGWLKKSKRITLKDSKKFDAAVHRAAKGFVNSNPELRKVLEGASTNLLAVSGIRQVALYNKRMHVDPLLHSPHARSPLSSLAMSWLRNNGWTKDRHDTWKHQHSTMQVPTRSWSKDIHLRPKHELHESWRATRWEAWKNDGRRREVLRHDVGAYDAHRMALVRKTFYKSTGSSRAVMLGSFMSPACLAVHFPEPERHSRCIWCNNIGTHDHIFWGNCPGRPVHLGPPEDYLFQRFGWPSLQHSDQRNLDIITHMATIVDLVWQHRHGVTHNAAVAVAASPGR